MCGQLRFLLCALLLCALPVSADDLDTLEAVLRDHPQVQEKVYINTDNNCYFIGDTIWYKAYVLRADDLMPTNMSRMLYVELLSPDGVVVERQRVVVSDTAYTCGQFALKDSLYSGYYELRAYTKWMLNFNVNHRMYTTDDVALFYNNAMAYDYYRDWDGLYSRVLPVYSKPQQAGDYDGKYMYERPKMETPFAKKVKLLCSFYPEGGQLVEGLRSRVAFEVTDQDGQAVTVSGRLADGTPVKSGYMGRGTFFFTPADTTEATVTFRWNGDDYKFKLPKAVEVGAVVGRQMTADSLLTPSFTLAARGCQPAAWAVLCRGKLYAFERLGSATTISPDEAELPTGVNELMVFDADGNVLADRLFFVNHHDMSAPVKVTTDKLDYDPYEPIHFSVSAPDAAGRTVSVALRDIHTDDPTYNDGNMMTDMLLSSDLKGFIASPAYYFERDDGAHREALDLLMMVQGWRKYTTVASLKKKKETVGLGRLRFARLRYQPETTFTIEGSVNKQLDVPILAIDDIPGLMQESINEEMMETTASMTGATESTSVGESLTQSESEKQAEVAMNTVAAESAVNQNGRSIDGSSNFTNDYSILGTDSRTNGNGSKTRETYQGNLGVNHGELKKEVMVEAEIEKDGMSAGLTLMTHDGGRFSFQVPPFYDKAVLFITAYNPKDSLKRSLTSGKDKHRFDEETYPDYYVKRDLFYPAFAHPYSYYQNHEPDQLVSSLKETDDSDDGVEGDHKLSTVKVQASRRGRRGVDYTKPAYVVDAYDLYNEATDRGLSWGVANMGYFPPIATATVYGNLNRYRSCNVVGKIGTYTFFSNYKAMYSTFRNRSNARMFNDLHLNRIQNIRFYTDFEPRNYTARHTEGLNIEDVIVSYELIPDDGKRYTYRDRRYMLPGFTYPEEQYQPDYSHSRPATPTDYRRTLYWNPNARLDASGSFSATAYNNSRQTRVQGKAEGQASDGRFLVQE